MPPTITSHLTVMLCIVAPCVSILSKSQYAKLALGAFARLDVYAKAAASLISLLALIFGIVNNIFLYPLMLAIPLYGLEAYFLHGMTRGSSVGAKHSFSTKEIQKPKPRLEINAGYINWANTISGAACIISLVVFIKHIT